MKLVRSTEGSTRCHFALLGPLVRWIRIESRGSRDRIASTSTQNELIRRTWVNTPERAEVNSEGDVWRKACFPHMTRLPFGVLM